MFTLVCFSSPQPAYTLMDYLSSQQISSVVSKSEQQYCVELVNEADMAEAQIITGHFINSPHDPRYQAASWDNDNHQLYTSRSGGNSSIFNGRLNLQFKSQLTRYPLTYLIMLVNIVVFGMMIVSIETRLWVDSMLFIEPLHELQHTGQWWRLLTPNFLHFSGVHIIFNLLWWWILARPIEQHLGKISLIITFVIISLSANIAQLYVDGPNFGGMSGVVYGLLGFTWWLSWLTPQWGFKIQPQIVGFMLVWLMIGYADVLFVSMANTAHSLGLVSGCLLALGWAKIGRSK